MTYSGKLHMDDELYWKVTINLLNLISLSDCLTQRENHDNLKLKMTFLIKHFKPHE